MEAGFIHFDPASEFEVIENIDFEEEISIPESLRFYNLDEQLLDYFAIEFLLTLPFKVTLELFASATTLGLVVLRHC